MFDDNHIVSVMQHIGKYLLSIAADLSGFGATDDAWYVTENDLRYRVHEVFEKRGFRGGHLRYKDVVPYGSFGSVEDGAFQQA
jgi:hypothetical protein